MYTSSFCFYFYKYNLKKLKSKISGYFFIMFWHFQKYVYLCTVKKNTKQMRRYFKRLFKRLGLRIYLKFKSISRTDMSSVDANEIKSSAICRKLISHPDSTFLIAPLSQKRYIKNDSLGVFIVLSNNRINITNHVYNYDVNLSQTISDKLNNIFDKKVERLRLEFETEIKSQIKHSLTTILGKLT